MIIIMRHLIGDFAALASSTTTVPTATALLNWSQRRHRKAVYFRKYRQPHYQQKLLLAACEPIKPIDRRPPAERCFALTPPPARPDHPYDALLAREMFAQLDESPLVAFLHQNQMSPIERRLMRNEYRHAGMHLRYYNRDIVRIACRGTRFEPLLPLAVGYEFTVLFVLPDDYLGDADEDPNDQIDRVDQVQPQDICDKISAIIRIAKRYPEVSLLGALADGRRLLTVAQLIEYGRLASLDMERAKLSRTLTAAQQDLSRTLMQHGVRLTQLLSQIGDEDPR